MRYFKKGKKKETIAEPLLETAANEGAVLFAKAHSRVLAPGLALLDPLLPPDIAGRSPLGLAWQHLDQVLDDFVAEQLIAV